MTYFCGSTSQCNKITREALHRAKENVEKVYSVVGVADQFNLSLSVLEEYLPSMKEVW